jgi:hypothetical protein
MDFQKKNYESIDYGDLVQNDCFALCNDCPPDLVRKDIHCECIKKENDDRAFLLYNFLTEKECKRLFFGFLEVTYR